MADKHMGDCVICSDMKWRDVYWCKRDVMTDIEIAELPCP